MGKIVVILIVILLLFLFLLLFPSIFMFLSVFGRKKGIRLTKENMKGSYYEPFEEKVSNAVDFIEKLPFSEVTVKAKDGVLLKGHFIDAGSKTTVMFVHGYKADYMDQFAVIGQTLYNAGYNLLFTWNRAHGESGGRFLSLGVLEKYDIIEWIDFQTKAGYKTILYGMSMGSAAVSYSLAELSVADVKAAILDCGFASPYEQICQDCKKWHIPRFLINYFIIYIYKLILKSDLKENTRISLSKSEIPALFIHGTEDRSVPVECGRENFKIYSGPKDSLFVEGADHTVALLCGGMEAEKKLLNFIKRSFEE